MQTFAEWFEIFTHELKKWRHSGPVDTESARIDYENDISPEDAAQSLFNELSD